MYSHRIQLGGEDTLLFFHPSPEADAVIINYPGYKGDINGYQNKYVTLAQYMANQKLGGVVRMPNIYHEHRAYKRSVIEDLRTVIEFVLPRRRELCVDAAAPLYLMGFSAGGGAVAAVAADYKEVTKILLMAPSMDASSDAIEKSLTRFTGDVLIVIGQNDEVVGPNAGKTFYKLAVGSCNRRLINIPNCDHQFRGRENSITLSRAPFVAFAPPSFSSESCGIPLYD